MDQETKDKFLIKGAGRRMRPGALDAMLFLKFLRKKYSLKRRKKYGIEEC